MHASSNAHLFLSTGLCFLRDYSRSTARVGLTRATGQIQISCQGVRFRMGIRVRCGVHMHVDVPHGLYRGRGRSMSLEAFITMHSYDHGVRVWHAFVCESSVAL